MIGYLKKHLQPLVFRNMKTDVRKLSIKVHQSETSSGLINEVLYCARFKASVNLR